ncbi:MAG TPA: hypothetical protein VM347_43745 [Nonomuraea sp.]|nr:hypothetical protein [Nonomuraea sp.]
MGNGFPDAKFFRIINEDTGLCLAAAHGGTIHGGTNRWRGVSYSTTNDQVLVVSTPKDERGEIWFFDDRKNSYGEEAWNLVNVNRDIRGAFSLHVGPLDHSSEPVELGLISWGRQGQIQWKADEGVFWPGSHDDKVVALLDDGNGNDNYRAVVADGDAPNQYWRFEEVELPGESVPTSRMGQSEMGGGDPLKWRARM